MEQSLMKVPFEQLRVAVKENTKRLGGEVEAALAALRSLAGPPDAEALAALEARLQQLHSAEWLAVENAALAQCRERAAHCSAVMSTEDVKSARRAPRARAVLGRVTHTRVGGHALSPPRTTPAPVGKLRCSLPRRTRTASRSYAQLDRLVVDHLLRTGHHDTALVLARETGTLQLVRRAALRTTCSAGTVVVGLYGRELAACPSPLPTPYR